MKLTWYGHSCFKLDTADGSVVFDPYAPGSVPGVKFPEGLEADAVYCSHAHRDHSYAEGVKLSGKEPAFKAEHIACYHDGMRGVVRGKNLITLIESEGLRVAHLGDLGHLPNDAICTALGRVDLLLIPVGGFFTINASEAAETAKKLGAKRIIPMHYRGEGFGYDVIGTVDKFCELMGGAEKLNTCVIEDIAALPEGVSVLRCPLE